MPPNGFHRRPKRLRRRVGAARRTAPVQTAALLPPPPGCCRRPTARSIRWTAHMSSAAPRWPTTPCETRRPRRSSCSTTPMCRACTHTSRSTGAGCTCATRPHTARHIHRRARRHGMDPNRHGANEARARMEPAGRRVDRDLPGGRLAQARDGSAVSALQSPDRNAARASGLTRPSWVPRSCAAATSEGWWPSTVAPTTRPSESTSRR